MRKPYTPKGTVAPLLRAMAADPTRVWSVQEAAETMHVPTSHVVGHLAYALRAEVVFRSKRNGRVVFSATRFGAATQALQEIKPNFSRRKPAVAGWATPEDDIRIPRIEPGWAPPQMVCVRQQR